VPLGATVAAFADVSAVGDGVGIAGPTARAAIAARSASRTSAVICARVCASCASSSGEPVVPVTGELAGCVITVSQMGGGAVGVPTGPVVSAAEEAVLPALG
jgi:hypothetical protein